MVEQIGVWFLSGALLIYPIVIWLSGAHYLGLGSMISLLCGLGAIARIVEILREVRSWRHFVEASS
jgi:hypothetical protein